jgi:geranylgeranyl diphosphate synthase type II
MTNDYFSAKRSLVDDQLKERLLAAEIASPALQEAMAYSLLAPGKRLRPLLVILAAEACGGRDSAALPAACAVEMIHAYSLIHDDLPAMDDDDLRRGLPACHKKFGDALAILAGDGLVTLAFQVLAESYPATTAAACCRELARAAGAAGMVGGQAEDLAWEGRRNTTHMPQANPEILETIHARKTGALFRVCLRLGVWVAQGEKPQGPSQHVLEAVDGYGRCFGQAFQIMDDLLDAAGDVEKTGKRVQKDAARGKLTYPGLLGLDESRRRAQTLSREAHRHLAPLGSAGDRLAGLVQVVLQRDR